MWVIPTILPRQKSRFGGVNRVCRIRVRIRVSFSCANLIFRRSVAVWIIPDWINTSVLHKSAHTQTTSID